jgi:hypothetical protein
LPYRQGLKQGEIMKLVETQNTNTKLGLKTQEWEYHTTQIDTNDISAIKVTAYDNAPDIKHMYEPNRYKVKCKIWMKGSDLEKEADHELTNKLTNYKSFRNNKYKTDKHKDWYINWVDQVKCLIDQNSCTGLAAPLGMRQGTSPKSNGYMHVPQWGFALFMSDTAIVGQLSIEEHTFDIEFEEEYSHGSTQAYVKEMVFE